MDTRNCRIINKLEYEYFSNIQFIAQVGIPYESTKETTCMEIGKHRTAKPFIHISIEPDIILSNNATPLAIFP